MKKLILLLLTCSTMISISAFTFFHQTGITNRTGSPFDGSTCTSCHSGGATTPSVTITANPAFGGGNTYKAGKTYTISVICSGSYPKYGFDLEILNSNGTSGVTDKGTFGAVIANCQKLGNPTNVTHTMPTGSGNTATFSFIWTAPASGTAFLYCAGNGVNFDGTNSGDKSTTVSMALTAAPGPTVTISNITNVKCHGGNNGSVTATASAGTPPYTYSWSSGAGTTTAATGLSAGNYTVTVEDAVGVTTAAVAITQPVALTASFSATNVSCKSGSDGSAQVSVTGGTTAYTYTWNSGQSTSSASGLSANTYTVSISDANNCTTSQSVSITEPALLTASITMQTNVSCNNGSNGNAIVTASGGTPVYTYSWNNGQSTSAATNLSAGDYTVSIVDAQGCTALQQTVSITEPAALTHSISAQTNLICNGDNNGSLSVSAGGGTPAYSYLWNNGQTSFSATGLIANNYTVTIKDAHNCTGTETVSITQPTVISASTTVTGTTCGNSNGSAQVFVNGGTGSYSYGWNPSGQTTASVTGLGFGNYICTITDANNCTKTAMVNVVNTDGPAVSISTQTDVDCYGNHNGIANISVSGGTFPYTFNWTDGQTTQNATGLSIGNYTVTVSDASSCINTQTVYISEPTILTPSINTQTNVSCNGGNNAIVAVAATGGSTPYTFMWNNGQTTSVATGLTANSYTLTISDSHTCTATQTVSISEPLALTTSVNVTDATSCIATDGSVTANVFGGTLPYSYLWSNNKTTTAITGLGQGSYSLTITDVNNCNNTTTVTVSCPNAVDELSMSSLYEVYPNPANGLFTMQFGLQEATLRQIIIYNIYGESIFATSNVSPLISIDISSQPNGIYFLSIKTEKEELNRKLIITH